MLYKKGMTYLPGSVGSSTARSFSLVGNNTTDEAFSN